MFETRKYIGYTIIQKYHIEVTMDTCTFARKKTGFFPSKIVILPLFFMKKRVFWPKIGQKREETL